MKTITCFYLFEIFTFLSLKTFFNLLFQKIKKKKKMQIFVKTLTGKYLTIEIERNEKVERIKEIIHNKEGIPIEFITLIRRGKFLNDQKLLIDYDIQKKKLCIY